MGQKALFNGESGGGGRQKKVWCGEREGVSISAASLYMYIHVYS